MMQEKVVYFLGAGFSAPLDLPVMSNFYTRSKDLLSKYPDKYSYFNKVFNAVDAMHKATGYYNANLFNIEEILSLLEMEDYATGSRRGKLFIEYLRDVIEELTPPFDLHTSMRGEWYDSIFGEFQGSQYWYCSFVASLFNFIITGGRTSTGSVHLHLKQQNEPSVRYAVISLNYDMVLERCLDLILRQCHDKPDLGFAGDCEEAEAPGRVPLAKLHGSVKPLTIVPPTWNKVARREVREAWKLAYKVLSEATQVRIVGYSLPITDAYVRYLLESASTQTYNLKNIDVICLDDSGSVQKQYRKFVSFDGCRFRGDVDIEDCLRHNWEVTRNALDIREENLEVLRFDKLERIHHKELFPRGWLLSQQSAST